ncbi:hypothetical protein HYQ44_011191 [Verticillium longisporum]|nr:hypothetical protein HYQ44_011191 [Verticillium longisporum]
MNTNVRIVFGLQLQAGVQPFMRKRGPSSLKLVRMIWTTDYRDHRSGRTLDPALEHVGGCANCGGDSACQE